MQTKYTFSYHGIELSPKERQQLEDGAETIVRNSELTDAGSRILVTPAKVEGEHVGFLQMPEEMLRLADVAIGILGEGSIVVIEADVLLQELRKSAEDEN